MADIEAETVLDQKAEHRRNSLQPTLKTSDSFLPAHFYLDITPLWKSEGFLSTPESAVHREMGQQRGTGIMNETGN